MADAITHIDVDSDEFDEAPKALRDYVKKLQRQNKELFGEVDGLRKTQASNAVSGVLADKGFKNPKRVEAAILADSIDPLDKSAVEKWLQDNGDDYAKAPETATPVASETPSPEQQAFEQMAGVSTQPAANMDAFKAAEAEITPAMSAAEVRAVFLKHGV